ncbi:MAG: sulfate respiration complex protein HmcE [Thermodesulfobacteriota bacterium]
MALYDFVTGPLLWIAVVVFVVGIVVRAVLYIRGLDWQLDRVTYRVNVKYGIKGALRSIFYFLVPFGTHSWRAKPGFTIVFFVFHLGLLVTPVFLLGHNILLKQAWGFMLPTLPACVADTLTIAVMICAVAIILRRMALPEVRIITTWSDILILAIAVAPFVTGYVASRGAEPNQAWLIAHVLSGELWLVAIPFTKLSHFVLFFLSRAQLGMDFGIKRGGMKSKGMAW